MELVRDLGEQGLLQRLFQFCPAESVGDDAALVAIAPDHELVVTTDLLVDGVHFSLGHAAPQVRTTSPEDAGWRAAAANLSDLAAMAAMPLGITVGLGLPGEVPVAWVEGLYEGMRQCLSGYDVPIVGGDVCRSPVTTIAITALGQVQPRRAIRRSQARPQDVIVATGIHGASRAGLELLLHPEAGERLTEGDRQRLIQAHQRPRPRLEVVSWLAAAGAFAETREPMGSPVAGMDSSDGLADAVLQICRASGVGARLQAQDLPMPSCFRDWLTPEQALQWTLYGGEDFELVLCLPEPVAIALCADHPEVIKIGQVTPELAVVLSWGADPGAEQILTLEQGFQHF
jgi:thiamine-monophosphate kinase